MRRFACGVLVALACEAANGQPEPQRPEFEIASVKVSPPAISGMIRVWANGGPGTKDPTLFTCENFSLSNLITMAYGIEHYRLSGPDWLQASMFDISARVPKGATRDQFKLMLQNLLADRFKLAVYHEPKDLPVYELVIAKAGPKLKESVEDVASKDDTTDAAPSRPPTPAPPKLGKDGYPELAPGRPGMIAMNGRYRMYWPKSTIERLCFYLAGQLGKPVTDATGLKGKYDISLYWSSDRGRQPVSLEESSAPAVPEVETEPTLAVAVQEQLGLKLIAKKGPVDVLVVDHAEKVPAQN
jgi:uncharacterized protein (TIGR03435 family)